ncbi:unnamed protein product [Clavelina lepadiformis]|uniref:Uncharacterized protein n=1 Tax=Clavelina lepadiformis TaxID=159417 RepID=A0ABP0GGX3_CLALP
MAFRADHFLFPVLRRACLSCERAHTGEAFEDADQRIKRILTFCPLRQMPNLLSCQECISQSQNKEIATFDGDVVVSAN